MSREPHRPAFPRGRPRRARSDEPPRRAPVVVPPESTQPVARLGVDPAAPIPAVFVRGKVLQPLVFRKRIARAEGARPGDFVAVYTEGDVPSGYGLYNPNSEIALRILFHGAELPAEDAWHARLRTAVSLRHDVLRLPEHTDAYRIVHGEADELSGIVIDRFADVLSAEVFSLGMYARAEALLDALAPAVGARHTRIQVSPAFLSQEGCEPETLSSAGFPASVIVTENGVRFKVRFEGGHKTGFFCDQRENRLRLASFCEGRSVLDLCCYTGGFSVFAKTVGKADEVIGVDLDETPLALAKENANLNQARVRFVQADAFAYMREMIANGRRFDVVVLDPPKLIRTRAELDEGTRKHFDLNRLAMRLVSPGGLLLTCSCAGLLPEDEFLRLLLAAARQAGPELPERTASGSAMHAPRIAQILARSGAAADHPVISNCLETEYLKAVWMVLR